MAEQIRRAFFREHGGAVLSTTFDKYCKEEIAIKITDTAKMVQDRVSDKLESGWSTRTWIYFLKHGESTKEILTQMLRIVNLEKFIFEYDGSGYYGGTITKSVYISQLYDLLNEFKRYM